MHDIILIHFITYIVVFIIIIHFYISDPTYFPQRCATIIANGKIIGKMGVIHPDVLQNFELNHPCSAIEINIEPFL